MFLDNQVVDYRFGMEKKTGKLEEMKKKKITILIITVVLFLWLLWGNKTVELNNITISSKDLPSAFSGYKIAQISDLHNAQFGNENVMLIRLLKEASPDIIVITGDIVDSTHTDMDTAIAFVRNMVEIAPCYYVTGNHEAWLGSDYNELENALIDEGVIVLHDEAVTLEKEGQAIQMIGVDAPDFSYIAADKIISAKLEHINITQEFTIMLSHRPELFDSYVENEIDLVLHMANLAEYDKDLGFMVVLMDQSRKKQTAELMGLKSHASVSNIIVNLIKNKILYRIGRSVYIINPNLLTCSENRGIEKMKEYFPTLEEWLVQHIQ